MTKNEMLELKNGDFVQVKKGNKWYNGIAIQHKENSLLFDDDDLFLYVIYFPDSETNMYGAHNFFSRNEIRLPNYDVTNNETLKKVKKLVDQLVVKGGK